MILFKLLLKIEIKILLRIICLFKELFCALTSFTQHVLDGKVSLSIQPVFCGATHIVLEEGDLRPIVVGQTMSRMVAKCAAHQVIHTIGTDLAPQ